VISEKDLKRLENIASDLGWKYIPNPQDEFKHTFIKGPGKKPDTLYLWAKKKKNTYTIGKVLNTQHNQRMQFYYHNLTFPELFQHFKKKEV
jgi:hypothetical protein